MASIVTRCVATASGVLSDRAEQSEALAILEKISTETGWRLGSMVNDMKRAWGWAVDAVEGSSTGASHSSNNAGAGFASTLLGAGQQSTLELPLPLPSRPPSISQLFGTSSHGHHQLPQPPQSSTTRTSSSTAAATSYSNSPIIPNLTLPHAAHGLPTYSITPSASSRRQSRLGPSPPPPTQTVGVSQQSYQGWYQQAAPQTVRTGSIGSQQMAGAGGAGGGSSTLG